MRIAWQSLSEVGSWIVVVCAITTTVIIVQRHLSMSSPTTINEPSKVASQVDGWEDVQVDDVGIRMGALDAPVQVLEFADFECPFCAQLEPTLREIADSYPEEVAVTFAHFPLAQIHASAESSAVAAECAHMQGRFEEMRLVLFDNQRAFAFVPWTDFARRAGVSDLAQFDDCVDDNRTLARIENGRRLGQRFGVPGTPTILINGWKFSAPPSSSEFHTIVRNILEGKPVLSGTDFAEAAT